MTPRWSRVSLIFLLIIALIGTMLRGAAYFDLPFSYEYLRHSHSHVAFQGWVYTLIMMAITQEFVPVDKIKKGKYTLQIGMTSVVIVGVLVSFALQGYAFFSILFSSLFQILNYWFIYRFFRDSKKKASGTLSPRWVKTGLWLGLVSSIVPWFIGVVSARGMAGTELYDALIYFFLHFQYNGWFLFIAFGLFFSWVERFGYSLNPSKGRRFYLLWTWAVVPSYFLSLLGMSFADWIRIPAIIAAFLQWAALIYVVPVAISFYKQKMFKRSFWLRLLMVICFVSFLLKTILQGLSIWPQLQEIAFFSRNIVMAYMHLSLIGVLTLFFLGWLLEKGWLANIYLVRLGLVLLILGFVVTEVILLISGMGWAQPLFTLFLFSGVMALGIALLTFGSFITNKPRLGSCPHQTSTDEGDL